MLRRSLLISVSQIASMSLGGADAANSDATVVTVQVAESIGEIEELRPRWSSWHRHPNSDINYYLRSLRTIPGTLRPHVMAVHRGGVLDCLLVGKLQEGLSPISNAGIPLPPARILYFVTEGFLGNRSTENAELLVNLVLHYLRQGRADVAEFNDLPEDSPLYRAASRLPGVLCRDRSPVVRIHRRLVLPATFQEYLRGLSAKERSNVRAHEKLLRNRFPGQVRVHRFCQGEIDTLIRDVETIAAKSYQRALGTGFTLADTPTLRLDAENSSLRAYVLYLQGEPSAFLIATWYKGTSYGRSIGYDPKYRRYSPGQHLLLCFIEDCFDLNGRPQTIAIDPGAGAQHYKRSFTNRETNEYSIAIYAPTAKGIFLNLLRTSGLLGARGAKAFLAKTGLTTSAWRMWKTLHWRQTPPH